MHAAGTDRSCMLKSSSMLSSSQLSSHTFTSSLSSSSPSQSETQTKYFLSFPLRWTRFTWNSRAHYTYTGPIRFRFHGRSVNCCSPKTHTHKKGTMLSNPFKPVIHYTVFKQSFKAALFDIVNLQIFQKSFMFTEHTNSELHMSHFKLGTIHLF